MSASESLSNVNGTLWFVRNGEILRLGNMSHGWARVMIDLAVPYDSDVDAIQDRILEVAVELSEDKNWRYRIIEKPSLWGIESISAEAIVVRVVVKTRSTAKDDVARELRYRLKEGARRHGREAAITQLGHALRIRGRGGPSQHPRRNDPEEPKPLIDPALQNRPNQKKPATNRCSPKLPATRTTHERRTRAQPGDAAPDQGGESVQGNFWEQVGGSPPSRSWCAPSTTASAPMRCCCRCIPSSPISGAIQRLTGFLEQAVPGQTTTYSEERGHPRLRMRHMPFKVNPDARDRWLKRMRAAVDSLNCHPCTTRPSGPTWIAPRRRWSIPSKTEHYALQVRPCGSSRSG